LVELIPKERRGWAVITTDASYALGNFLAGLISYEIGSAYIVDYFRYIYLCISVPMTFGIYFMSSRIPETP